MSPTAWDEMGRDAGLPDVPRRPVRTWQEERRLVLRLIRAEARDEHQNENGDAEAALRRVAYWIRKGVHARRAK